MTGKELVDEGYLNDSLDLSWNTEENDLETMPEMWSRKERESELGGISRPSLRESMEKHGYLEGSPSITIFHGNGGIRRVHDAHHRIATAAALERQKKRQIFFPVEHQEPFNAENWDKDFGQSDSSSSTPWEA